MRGPQHLPKPRTALGYKIDRIEIEKDGKKLFLGYGVIGPEVKITSIVNLRTLGFFLLRAADWLEKRGLKSQAAGEARDTSSGAGDE